jgi:APA family basic amino acid/polyamine antiporter
LTLTGIVNYKELGVAAPYALAVDRIQGFPGLAFWMKLGSLLGLTTVMLVMLLGQSRVFYSMSKDGLLPRVFSDCHLKFRTPYKSNLLLMLFVGVLAGFTPISLLGQLTSIGTLCAFIVVCIGIVILRRTRPDLPRPYKTPFVPFVPILGVIANFALMYSLDNLTWASFILWMMLGLVIYFAYSRKHSKLQQTVASRS